MMKNYYHKDVGFPKGHLLHLQKTLKNKIKWAQMQVYTQIR